MPLFPGPFGVAVEYDVRVLMRDGIHLATDIYRPLSSGGKRWPCVLERTPYDKTGVAASDFTAEEPLPVSKPVLATWLASHGFVVVMQDCRGRYRSGGNFVKYVNEALDGVDSVRWLMAQPWCDGRVLTQGLSYGAHVQTALGGAAPAGLAGQFVDSGGFSNAFHSGIRQGGAFELKQATWAYKHALLSPKTKQDSTRRAALQAQDIRAWFARMPWSRGDSPVSAAPEFEDYLFEQWEHENFDAFWKKPELCGELHYEEYADVPMVHLSSWYDPYVRTAIDNYLGLSRRKYSRICLVMGPWVHGRRSQTFAGDVDFGQQSTIDAAFGMSFYELRRQWYNQLLGRGDLDPFSRGPVVIFIMGGGAGRRDANGRLEHGGRWVYAQDWPLPDVQERSLYLHDQDLVAQPPSSPGLRTFVYDPRRPVPTIGGNIASGEPVMSAGAFDQKDDVRFFGCSGSGIGLDQRPDVLTFRSEPLLQELDVVGVIRARLFVSSTCVDTDITIKLIDEYPPGDDYPAGFAMNISDGILRLKHRDSWEQSRLLNPGECVEIDVETFSTANRFARGHRIRLDISSSNFPHFDLNPNTGARIGNGQTFVSASNTVHFGGLSPSRLLLPILQVRGNPDYLGGASS